MGLKMVAMLRTPLLVFVMGTLFTTCHRSQVPVLGPPGPVITRLDPSSGAAGQSYPLQVTIDGTGFADSGNVVRFGGERVLYVVSESRTRIVFQAPKERPTTGEVPPMVLLPGEYEVTVQTATGTSAPVVFTLTRGP